MIVHFEFHFEEQGEGLLRILSYFLCPSTTIQGFSAKLEVTVAHKVEQASQKAGGSITC